MLAETIELISQVRDPFAGFNSFYRGQSNADWKLIPRIGRANRFFTVEINIWSEWIKSAALHIDIEKYSDIDLLVLAQHKGLPTRLLDWSKNPLVAIFFACSENFDFDGKLFTLTTGINNIYDSIESAFDSEKEIQEIIELYNPRNVDNRVLNQSAIVSIHYDGQVSFDCCQNKNSFTLKETVIPSKSKRKILRELEVLGINYYTIYPDLDGLSKKISFDYFKQII